MSKLPKPSKRSTLSVCPLENDDRTNLSVFATPSKLVKLDDDQSLKGSAKKKDFDCRSLRQQRVLLESENTKLSSELSRVSSENLVLAEKLRQCEENQKSIEIEAETKVKRKDEQISEIEKRLEYYQNQNELLDTKLNSLVFDHQSDIQAEKSKNAKLEVEISEHMERVQRLETELATEKSNLRGSERLYTLMRSQLESEVERLKTEIADNHQFVTESKDRLERAHEMENEIKDLKVKLSEYETSLVINSANRSLEKQLLDMQTKLKESTDEIKFYKDLSGNTILLNEDKRTLEQTNERLKQEIEELLPAEEKRKEAENDLKRWNSVIQAYYPELTTPLAVLNKLSGLSSEISVVKSQLIEARNSLNSTLDFSMMPDGIGVNDSNSVKQIELVNEELKVEKAELEKQIRFLEHKLTLTEKQRDSGNNLLSSFEAEAEMSGDERNGKIIESQRKEIENYKEMTEEYDKTVKELRAQLCQLQSYFANRTRSNSELETSVVHSMHEGNNQSMLDATIANASSHNLTSAFGDKGAVDITLSSGTNPKNTRREDELKVLTLREDLITETKRAIYTELETLRSENSSMKEKLLKLAAEKKKAEEKRSNRLDESQMGVPVGERTMASCVQNSSEYKQLENIIGQREALLKAVKHRYKSVLAILRCLGYDLEFKETDTETVILIPIFRPPPNDSTITDSDDYFIELEKIEGKWHIMPVENLLYDAYSHLLNDELTHSAPFFAYIIQKLYEEFDVVEVS